MVHVTEIAAVRQLDAYYLQWKSLWSRTRGRTFFQTLDFYRSVCETSTDSSPCVLMVHGPSGPIGILPLLRTRAHSLWGNMVRLEYAAYDRGTLTGPVGPEPTVTLVAALRHIRDNRSDWDVVDLGGVNRQQIDCGRTQSAFELTGLAPIETTTYSHSVVDANHSWERFQNRHPLFLQSVCRAEKELGGDGAIQFERQQYAGAATGDGKPDWSSLVSCANLRSATTTSNRIESILGQQAIDIYRTAAQCGMLDVSRLSIEGQLVASCIGVRTDGRYMALQTSHVSADAAAVLLSRLIRDCCEGDDACCYLGEMSSLLKEGSQNVPCHRYVAFARRPARAKAKIFNLLESWTTGTAR